MNTKDLIAEAQEKNRLAKTEIIRIMDSLDRYNWSNEKIKDELFKLFRLIK